MSTASPTPKTPYVIVGQTLAYIRSTGYRHLTPTIVEEGLFKVPVRTLAQASTVIRDYVTRTGMGSSATPRELGDVYANGKLVAHVSYNGRVWEPGRFPTPEITGERLHQPIRQARQERKGERKGRRNPGGGRSVAPKRRNSEAPKRRNERRFGRSTDVQTLLFDDALFTPHQAKAWARKEGYKYGSVDTPKGGSRATRIRLRQRSPRDFQPRSFRTITLTDGVEAVIGVPKRQDVGKRGAHVKATKYREALGYGSRGPRRKGSR